MDKTQKQYIKMTETPINRLVVSLGIPTIISMLVSTIYNMADTYFVSTLGTSASGAIGIVFALMTILQAFGFMFGHGAGSNISRLLGSKQIEKARNYSAMAFYSALLFSLVMMVLGLIFKVPLVTLLGSTDSILPYASCYATYILLAAPGFVLSCVLNNILRYEGKAMYSMIGLGLGGLLNILGDYIFIVVFDMGVDGAGLSTMITQYLGFLILGFPFLQKKLSTSIHFKYLTFDLKILWKILSVGFPSLVRQGMASISTMILNWCAHPYGDAAIAAMGIVARVTQFLFCVALGMGQGFQPVCSFNYGAKKYTRVKQAFKFTLVFGLIFIFFMSMIGCVFTRQIITLFRDDPKVIEIGTFALRAQCLCLWCSPINVCGNMLFQSIGKSKEATFLSSLRSGVIFIPLILILSQVLHLTGIQIAQGVADLLAAAITFPMTIKFLKTLPQD